MAYVKSSNSSEPFYGTSANDLIDGLAGNDTLYGYAGNDTLSGGDRNDVLYEGLRGTDVVVVEDSQPGHFLGYPILFRVVSGLALAGIRVLDEALAVPGDPADMHLVVEDAAAALRVVVDGAEIPRAAGGDGILSLFRATAMILADLTAAQSRQIWRKTATCTLLITQYQRNRCRC